ncbi:hypothetical protein C9374_009729 [Naegleria lovaniensis]|uniref:non-specific serine/threonine protein kinase n=1 Tax=Naegleria lovaniensis TaxID=51637 RepID=A0AA88H5B2_NAELO|nr:uncharacterized protein C9374_009729 [Naegleria lovaniensis]KAG2393152.1 hypothetical protein C9374_009729 [Naegleria lovaniensis]
MTSSSIKTLPPLPTTINSSNNNNNTITTISSSNNNNYDCSLSSTTSNSNSGGIIIVPKISPRQPLPPLPVKTSSPPSSTTTTTTASDESITPSLDSIQSLVTDSTRMSSSGCTTTPHCTTTTMNNTNPHRLAFEKNPSPPLKSQITLEQQQQLLLASSTTSTPSSTANTPISGGGGEQLAFATNNASTQQATPQKRPSIHYRGSKDKTFVQQESDTHDASSSHELTNTASNDVTKNIPSNDTSCSPTDHPLKAFLDIYDNRILIVDSSQLVATPSNPPKPFIKPKTVSETLLKTHTKRSFHIESILGRGCFGCVYLCREEINGSPTGERMALKIVSPSGNVMPNVYGEYKLMKSLEHESVMKVYDYYEMLTSLQPGAMFTMKYYEKGDLRQFIEEYEKKDLKISIHWIYDFILQMADCLSFMHKRKIIHRDLKPENIFLEECSEHTCKIVLGDFGLAKNIPKSHGLFSQVGTMNYWSPEIVNNDEYGSETDIWSLGCVMYELMTLKSKQVERIVTLRQEGALVNDMVNRYPQEIPMIELIVKMLNKHHKDRPSAEEILNQPYMIRFSQMKQVCEHIVTKLKERLEQYKSLQSLDNFKQVSDILHRIQKFRATSYDSDELRILLHNAYTLLGEKLPDNIDLKPKKPKHKEFTKEEKTQTPKKKTPITPRDGNMYSSLPSAIQPSLISNQFRVTVGGDDGSEFDHIRPQSQGDHGGHSSPPELQDMSSPTDNNNTHLKPNVNKNVNNSDEVETPHRKRSISRPTIISHLKGLVGYGENTSTNNGAGSTSNTNTPTSKGVPKLPRDKRDLVIKAPNPANFHHDVHIGIDDKQFRISGNYPKDFDDVLSDMKREMEEETIENTSQQQQEEEIPPRLHRRSTSLFEKSFTSSELDLTPGSPTKGRSATVSNATPTTSISVTATTSSSASPRMSPLIFQSSKASPSTPSNSEILKFSPRIDHKLLAKLNNTNTPSSNNNSSNHKDATSPPLGGAFKLISNIRQQDILESYIEEACNSPTVSRRKR